MILNGKSISLSDVTKENSSMCDNLSDLPVINIDDLPVKPGKFYKYFHIDESINRKASE